ncbi:hypothetical protein [Roseicella aerolata]|uniref:IrrE N-terminal-like domain-containing protein n=1 Tax=Roseicella aerolata TaxID=2883479 RepID=A0A9X1II46_9PROT|nr:hypothetical protein [Roseicella aerolata]MCB4823813.1 hypothetical protein [Roseicella aerolata]
MGAADLMELPNRQVAVAWACVRDILNSAARPSARELVVAIEAKHGPLARWHIADAIKTINANAGSVGLLAADREYLRVMEDDGSLDAALRGEGAKEHDVVSTVDALLRQSAVYRSSASFCEMVDFMGKFRRYSAYNNMLVRIQNPRCGFYATEKTWTDRFKRWVKVDARPMLILAPMHPVMLVYALDDTDGPPLPAKLADFAQFTGDFDQEWLRQLIANAAGHRIRVAFLPLSSTHAGFATRHLTGGDWKMRIAVHEGLDAPSRFGILCHEIAHVLLGHLGSDYDGWWPARSNLTHRTVEIEVEAIAHIVTTRFGLAGHSAGYLSSYTKDGAIPETVSLDFIAKVAGHIEKMATEPMPARKPRKPPVSRSKAQAAA